MKKRAQRYTRLLTIAGSDSGGGAGIQADLKTFAAHRCYGMSVITALTAQNTIGVSAIHPVPVDIVRAQIEAVLGDIGADAIKIGMLFSCELIETVAATLRDHDVTNIVLDPVMVAQSGDRLLTGEVEEALKEQLLPVVDLVTPNLPEASVLLGRSLLSAGELTAAAREIAAMGTANVLIKGGHLEEGDCDDLLYLGGKDRLVPLSAKRVATQNNHGTGCTLSSAIACGLAQGQDMAEAVRHAKAYITGAIEAGASYQLGSGHGPVHHFYQWDTPATGNQ
ncbi:MAG: bifunctional hydroxymethylpyrimidine kinase/phosphomethylpyrimidine kinase [Deltaproteobacteria bacterium]|nr:MAG: bifunctional hydroxymethylpyrimidine kinase/phosphomethylpyrimidine kinase [Deltaproteobacteria bacterium]